MHGEDDDEQLRRLLRSADKAATQQPMGAGEAERLRERIMLTPQERTIVPRRRRGWVFGGAGVIGAAAAAAIAIPLAVGTGGASVTALQGPPTGGPAAACAEVSADALRPATLAFKGEVISIDESTVTLRVTDRFTGDIADTVELPQGSGDDINGDLPRFETGGSYLVAAREQIVLGCGATGPDTSALRQIYNQAF